MQSDYAKISCSSQNGYGEIVFHRSNVHPSDFLLLFAKKQILLCNAHHLEEAIPVSLQRSKTYYATSITSKRRFRSSGRAHPKTRTPKPRRRKARRRERPMLWGGSRTGMTVCWDQEGPGGGSQPSSALLYTTCFKVYHTQRDEHGRPLSLGDDDDYMLGRRTKLDIHGRGRCWHGVRSLYVWAKIVM